MNSQDIFRPMRRFKQQLPDEENVAILSTAYRGYLSVNGENGYPYTVPMNFVYDCGHIYFHSALEGHKVDVLKSNSKACFTVICEPIQEENDWWYHVKSVICFGQVQFITDEEDKVARLTQLGKKYFPSEYNIEEDLKKNFSRTLVLDFKIEHITGKQVKER